MKRKRNLDGIIREEPKILVGSPVYSSKKYITPYWIERVKNLSYLNYDIVVVDNSKPLDNFEKFFEKENIKVIKSKFHKNAFKRLAEARKKLNQYAIENGYSYLMSIEQDVVVPVEILASLLTYNKKVIGAPYIVSAHTNKDRRCQDLVISASKLDKILGSVDSVDVNEWYLASEIADKGLIQVKSCSLGCTLIDVEVLKEISVRCNPQSKRSDDSYFFHDCYIRGIPVFLDTSFLWKVEHIKRLGGEIQTGRVLKYDKY